MRDECLPPLRTFDDVLRFVIEEMGAMCPSLSRLTDYVANRHVKDFSDVHYHVEEADCRLCQAKINEFLQKGE